jgi:hypothetical protein
MFRMLAALGWEPIEFRHNEPVPARYERLASTVVPVEELLARFSSRLDDEWERLAEDVDPRAYHAVYITCVWREPWRTRGTYCWTVRRMWTCARSTALMPVTCARQWQETNVGWLRIYMPPRARATPRGGGVDLEPSGPYGRAGMGLQQSHHITRARR